MSDWSLENILSGLHDVIEQRLSIARKAFAHAPTKGDAAEQVWLELLTTYLPERYSVASAHIVDTNGVFSDQIDVVIFDRQYTPFILQFGDKKIIPAEAVYAAFEAKQTINAALVKYAGEKIASVRALHRTSLPIPHAGGVFDPKVPPYIIGGILTLDSEWSPPLGDTLMKALTVTDPLKRLDLGCVASHGMFIATNVGIELKPGKISATMFLFELIARLQESATVPMIDIRAYARWLKH